MSTKRIRLSMVSSLGHFLEDESSIAERLYSGYQAAFAALCREDGIRE